MTNFIIITYFVIFAVRYNAYLRVIMDFENNVSEDQAFRGLFFCVIWPVGVLFEFWAWVRAVTRR